MHRKEELKLTPGEVQSFKNGMIMSGALVMIGMGIGFVLMLLFF